jgi:hypothetical protein
MTEVNPEVNQNNETKSDIVSTGSGFKIKVSGNVNSTPLKTNNYFRTKLLVQAIAPSDDIPAIANDPVLTNAEKVEKLQDIVAVKRPDLARFLKKLLNQNVWTQSKTARRNLCPYSKAI